MIVNLKKNFLIIGLLTFIGVMLGLYINTYFVHKEIMHMTNTCFENKGVPTVSKGFLSISWSLTCK
ncbi:hypothetical protein [Lysinibacillus parviboronicapiens]|uniref:hypothetical protein n=1 Tax=Lysinibacillus parviboronicapiens TaxID=436516 RepID=UPI000D3C173D|nr:hypothetical protein [Lysinibacillus parviboronicapiens]